MSAEIFLRAALTLSGNRLFCVYRQEEGEDDDPSTRRGFDTLRNNGMTRGEVVAIRGYFSAQVREVNLFQTCFLFGITDDRSVGRSVHWLVCSVDAFPYTVDASVYCHRGTSIKAQDIHR